MVKNWNRYKKEKEKHWNNIEAYKIKIKSSVLRLKYAPSIPINGLAYIVLNIFYIFINIHAHTYIYISFFNLRLSFW